ncbi:hypothetical protein [Prolixibacter bellariivorans]|uniref:hypothetical protein n=1 Tax=Prolixibacter bellariivorans TaxID=314319 RepID=UPI0018FFC4B7|nr:hypothetical protein [Prolixibacter bellariivorans]
MNQQTATTLKTDRIFAIDFFRGITMFLLIGESTHLFHYLVDPSLDGTLFLPLAHNYIIILGMGFVFGI